MLAVEDPAQHQHPQESEGLDHVPNEGEEVAVSIDPGGLSVTYGRQFDANDKLYSFISRRSINALKQFFVKELKEEDVRLLIKLKKQFQIE